MLRWNKEDGKIVFKFVDLSSDLRLSGVINSRYLFTNRNIGIFFSYQFSKQLNLENH